MDYLFLGLFGIPLFVMSCRFWAGLIRKAARNAGTLSTRIQRIKAALAEAE